MEKGSQTLTNFPVILEKFYKTLESENTITLISTFSVQVLTRYFFRAANTKFLKKKRTKKKKVGKPVWQFFGNDFDEILWNKKKKN